MTDSGDLAHEGVADSTGPSGQRWLLVTRGIVALLGLGLAGAGVAAVFTTENDGGSAALLVTGTLLVLLAVLWEQLEAIRYGNVELVLRKKANEAEGALRI